MLRISHPNTLTTEPTTCPDLPPLTNGMITYSGGSTNNRPLESGATHSCNTGYTLTGGTTRTCGSDGMWSGLAPICQRKWNGLCSVYLLSVYRLPYS